MTNLIKDHPSTHENIINNKNNNNNGDQNLIKELIGDKPGRLMLQLPRLKYDISVSDYMNI